MFNGTMKWFRIAPVCSNADRVGSPREWQTPILRRYCASSLCDLRLRCYLATQEISNCTSDFVVVGLQREVARIEEVYLGAGLSRLYASAPGGRKNGSFLPQTASSGGRFVRKYSWNFGIERDIAGVIQKQVELDLIIAGSRHQCQSRARTIRAPPASGP